MPENDQIGLKRFSGPNNLLDRIARYDFALQP